MKRLSCCSFDFNDHCNSCHVEDELFGELPLEADRTINGVTVYLEYCCKFDPDSKSDDEWIEALNKIERG